MGPETLVATSKVTLRMENPLATGQSPGQRLTGKGPEEGRLHQRT